MNRTDAIRFLREALADAKKLAIVCSVLPCIVRATRKVVPPTGHAGSSVNPDALIASSWELDGEDARAAQAYALANSLTIEIRVLTGDEAAGADDVADQVETFGRRNGPEVDPSEYKPLSESPEPPSQEEEDGEDTASRAGGAASRWETVAARRGLQLTPTRRATCAMTHGTYSCERRPSLRVGFHSQRRALLPAVCGAGPPAARMVDAAQEVDR
jgi:hypothetical protein